MHCYRPVSIATVLCVAFVASVLWVEPADARGGKPEDVFKGQIITAKKPIPRSAKSRGAYIKTLKKMKATNFFENKDKKSWRIYYAAFFKKPLNDLEVTVRLYDVTSGGKRLLSTFEQYLGQRGQRTLLANITLKRESFGVNRQLLMVVENRRRTLAATKFKILGEAEKFSGEADFTDE